MEDYEDYGGYDPRMKKGKHMMGMGGVEMMFKNENKEWCFQFNSKNQNKKGGAKAKKQKPVGPYGKGFLQFVYKEIHFAHLFGMHLRKSNGSVLVKRISDTVWTEMDEIGLMLLIMYLNNPIPQNAVAQFVKQLINRHKGEWVYRYGSSGNILKGPSKLPKMTENYDKFKKHDFIAIKRIGESGNKWCYSNDIELHILFYHLSIHTNKTVEMGIENIEQMIYESQTQKLVPSFTFDEWELIKQLMKSMRLNDKYFDFLKQYCIDQEFEEIDALIDDLEEFVTSDDYEGSMIIDHFREEYEFDTNKKDDKDNDDDDTKQDGVFEDTNENDTNSDEEQEYIKLGFILYQSCRLLPVLREWSEHLSGNYLEKHFSYARCIDHKFDPCSYVKRLVPMLKYAFLWNNCVVNIPGDINTHSPYWITQRAFFSVLPHYSVERLLDDWQRLQKLLDQATADLDVLRDLMAEDDDVINDEDPMARSDSLKLFHWFDKHCSDIQCDVEDCHITNRRCFPIKSHVPYPIPYHWKKRSKRTKQEMDVTRALDEIHHMIHHSEHKFKYLKITDDPLCQETSDFIEKRKDKNEKYYNKDPPKLYYFEDNLVGKGAL